MLGQVPGDTADAGQLVACIELELEITDVGDAEVEAVLGLRGQIQRAHRDAAVGHQRQQAVGVGARDDEVPVAALVLDDLGMPGGGGGHAPGLEAGLLDELADQVGIGLVAKDAALAALRQPDSGVLQLDPQQRTLGIGLDAVADHQALEHRGILGFTLAAQLDRDVGTGLKKRGVAECKLAPGGVPIHQHQAGMRDAVDLAPDVDRQQRVNIVEPARPPVDDGGSDDAHAALSAGACVIRQRRKVQALAGQELAEVIQPVVACHAQVVAGRAVDLGAQQRQGVTALDGAHMGQVG